MGINYSVVHEMIKHEFDDSEMKELSLIIAEQVSDIESIKEEKAAIVAEYAGRLKAAALEQKNQAKKIVDGFEMRREECYVIFDYRARKVAYFLRSDTDSIDWGYFPFERFENFSDWIESFVDQNDKFGNVSIEAFCADVERKAAGLKPVKMRGMRNSEYHSQTDLFAGKDQENGDPSAEEIVDTETGDHGPPDGTEESAEEILDGVLTTEEVSAENEKAEEEQTGFDFGRLDGKRNNTALAELLTFVCDKSPSTRTIQRYSDGEYDEARIWAVAEYWHEEGAEVEVPVKPAFLPE